jgi:WD40 repeat protein
MCGALHSGSGDKTVKARDIGTGACQRTLMGNTDVVRALCAFRMSSAAAAGGIVKGWTDGSCLCIFQGHSGPVYAPSFFGERLCSISSDHTVKLWDVATAPDLLQDPCWPFRRSVVALRCQPLGSSTLDGATCNNRIGDLST